MLLKYFYDERLAHASYLVGCQKTGEAIIVDPGRDISPYLLAAKQHGMKITGVAETHIHADYVSGARELADRVGATLYLSDEGPAEWKYQYAENYSYHPLKEGSTFNVGNICLEVIHTPGHTPESVSFLLTDRGSGADQPMGIFTGDFVFVGSIGRPALLEEAAGIRGTAEAGARDLFQSIKKFRNLPDHLQVWPAHGAGSACGKGLGSIPSSTVGYEKLFNPALQYHNQQDFVDYILSEQPEPPNYFALMKRVNKEGPDILGAQSLPEKLTPQKLNEIAQTFVVVDTAPANIFGQGHAKGTINIEPKHLAMWGGSILNYDQPIYLVVTPQNREESIRILEKIGIEKFGGYFDANEVAAAGLNTESIPQVPVREIASQLAAGVVQMVDVRGQSERTASYIPQSTHHFLGHFDTDQLSFDPAASYVFQCRSGNRSMIAASIAQRAGVTRVFNLEGGIDAWKKAGLSVRAETKIATTV